MNTELNAEGLTIGKLGGMMHWTGCKESILRTCHPQDQKLYGVRIVNIETKIGEGYLLNGCRAWMCELVATGIAEAQREANRMSDLISRQAAIDAMHKSIFDFFDICDDDEESPMTYKDEQLLEINKAIATRIKELPSAQPEIVRCKECKYADFDDLYGNYWCNRTMCVSKVNADDFCSKGGKRCLK